MKGKVTMEKQGQYPQVPKRTLVFPSLPQIPTSVHHLTPLMSTLGPATHNFHCRDISLSHQQLRKDGTVRDCIGELGKTTISVALAVKEGGGEQRGTKLERWARAEL